MTAAVIKMLDSSQLETAASLASLLHRWQVATLSCNYVVRKTESSWYICKDDNIINYTSLIQITEVECDGKKLNICQVDTQKSLIRQ